MNELDRLAEARAKTAPWKQWGPYLSERQWGTVREDYSSNGDAWGYFSHDEARSRAYRWGEDGIAGISDNHQRLCFALALWNGADPILKERLFGLTNNEGNHGEDVKEYYFYLDSTPTHSYMKYLYKYPQRAYPYEQLVRTNGQRNRFEMEYELLDTGIFDENRYFDVFVEYAKAAPDDLLIQITAANRGPETASLHLVPTLWFRNTWAWGDGDAAKPMLERGAEHAGWNEISAIDAELGTYTLSLEGAPLLLFTENETNTERIFGTPNASPFVKDGIHNFVVHNRGEAVNPGGTGTKAAGHFQQEIGAGESRTIRLRLRQVTPTPAGINAVNESPFQEFDAILDTRRQEADEFYASITPEGTSEDEARVMRQALAGMLWSKQFYFYDVKDWLGGTAPQTRTRNRDWFHMYNHDILSMPDKWEYPWYAAWDLAFHTVTLYMVDADFAKEQLSLMVRHDYLHPNGQIPAYEWNFSDVNPPVHAWAAYFIYWNEKLATGKGDLAFLERIFQSLAFNFTWWVNRKDAEGKNVFQGGFLGLDNIGVFDRSAPLPSGRHLEQADGTAWMAFYSQMMLQIALELAIADPAYEELACKFYEHFVWIVAAMDRIGDNGDELWDEQDGFFYDVLRFPDGRAARLQVRSMVGLLSLAASVTLTPEMIDTLPVFMERVNWFKEHHPEIVKNIHGLNTPGVDGRLLLSLLDETKLRRVLGRMLDENEFLGPYGIRSLSRFHREHPYEFTLDGQEYRVAYEPAESTTGLFGGNSNWRGPVWMPVNVILIRGLITNYLYYGDDLQVECPTGSGNTMNLWNVSAELSRRLVSMFVRDRSGRRPVYGGSEKFQNDPHWRDAILFYEYFHSDNGAGIGASHQTGWTGLVAKLIQIYHSVDPTQLKGNLGQAVLGIETENDPTRADS